MTEETQNTNDAISEVSAVGSAELSTGFRPAFMAPLQSSAEGDSCLGWLQKRFIGCKKLSFVLSWRNRYFMLASGNGSMYMRYYEDKLCQKPIDVIRPGPADTCVCLPRPA